MTLKEFQRFLDTHDVELIDVQETIRSDSVVIEKQETFIARRVPNE